MAAVTAVSTLLSTRTAKASRTTLLLSLESTLRSAETARAAVVLGTTLLLSLESTLGSALRSAGTLLVTVLVTTLVVLVLVVLIVVVAEETHDG